MADNKQNTETENKQPSGENKPMTGGGIGAASTQQAREGSPATNKPGNQPASPVGATSQTGGTTSQTGSVTDTAKDTLNQVKDSAGTVATEAIGQVKDKASSVLDEQKTNLASSAASVAESIRKVGENLGNSGENNQVAAIAGKYGENIATQIEKFSSYIDEKELKELVRDVEQFARRNPLLFVGGAFTLGIFAARFLKSSGRKQNAGRQLNAGRRQNAGQRFEY